MKKQPTPKPNAKRNSKPTPRPGVKHRPTAGEKEKRTDTIVGLILSGTRRGEICEFVRVQWGLGEAQADRYISDANAIIKAESAKTREDAFAEHVEIRRQIRKRALADGDNRVALAAAQDEAKLRDLYPAVRQRIDGEIVTRTKPAEEMTDDELAAIAAQGRPGPSGADTPGSAQGA